MSGNLSRMFNLCLMVLLLIVLTALFAAVMIPARIVYHGQEILLIGAVLRQIGCLAALWTVWTAMFCAVSVAPLLKPGRK